MSDQNFTKTQASPGANLANQEEPGKPDAANTVDNVTLNISDISEMPLLESTSDMLSATATTTIVTHFQDSFPLNQQSIQESDTINENLIRENEAMLSSTSSYYHENQADSNNLHDNENMENTVLNKVDQIQSEQPDETQINEKESSNFLEDSLDIPDQSLIGEQEIENESEHIMSNTNSNSNEANNQVTVNYEDFISEENSVNHQVIPSSELPKNLPDNNGSLNENVFYDTMEQEMGEEPMNTKDTGVVLSSGNSSLVSQTILSFSLIHKNAIEPAEPEGPLEPTEPTEPAEPTEPTEPTELMEEQEHNESPSIPIYNRPKSKIQIEKIHNLDLQLENNNDEREETDAETAFNKKRNMPNNIEEKLNEELESSTTEAKEREFKRQKSSINSSEESIDDQQKQSNISNIANSK